MEEILQFFDAHPDAFPLYDKFEKCVTEHVPEVRIKVQKTQISFYNRHMFACVSFARVRKKKDCPDWITGQFPRGSILPRSRIRTAGHITY